jgi:hypothetical protein
VPQGLKPIVSEGRVVPGLKSGPISETVLGDGTAEAVASTRPGAEKAAVVRNADSFAALRNDKG